MSDFPTIPSKVPSQPTPPNPPSPILQKTPHFGSSSPIQTVKALTSPSQPEFAEFLTPAKLRPKRRKGRQHLPNVPTDISEGTDGVIKAGPSRQGYTTVDGDLFRGAAADPTQVRTAPDEDAITIGGSSSTSSSSSWSWQSDLERGRRATRAVIDKIGEAIRRRGSISTISTMGTEARSEAPGPSRRRRLSRILSRSATRATDVSLPEKPKYQHLPRKREFTLLLPSGSEVKSESERILKTPSLPVVLEKVRALRLSTGFARETPAVTPTTPLEEIPIRRGGSAPGAMRSRHRGPQSFIPPPKPVRPPHNRARTRVEALKMSTGEPIIRPKSVSDLMGISNPYTSPTDGLDKGKQSPSSSPISTMSTPSSPLETNGKGCWWLDVSCPSWEDLRDIGELLGLHPLTLEDVLQQDPREKLDTFDTLGYYFIVARALDEQYFKYTPGAPSSNLFGKMSPNNAPASPPSDPTPITPVTEKIEHRRRGWGMGRAAGKLASTFREKVEIVEDNPGKEGLEGVGVGAVNLYLVVFADGIVSFHFEDITKHTKRVLDKILSLASEAEGSDWIAHGLLDSIVDAFFPLIRYVDGEVDEIDSITIDPSAERTFQSLGTRTPSPSLHSLTPSPPIEAIEMNEKISLDDHGDKIWRTSPPPPRSKRPDCLNRFTAFFPALPRIRVWLPHQLIYIRLFWLPTSDASRSRGQKIAESSMDRSKMIRRITETRRLVTGLSRLLGSKQVVVGRLRKRAKEVGGGVEAYIGDLEDHILLLETSLSHYEYILSHCQPAYLSHLNVGFSFVRGKRDRGILALSVVTISILPMLFITSLFSMNVRIPHNGPQDYRGWEASDDGTIAPFSAFGGIVTAVFLVACAMVSVVRYWRYLAKRKWAGMRGAHVKGGWDTYWGWH